VHFTLNELFWDCRQLQACECRFDKLPDFWNKDGEVPPVAEEHHSSESWYEQVEEYTALELTLSKDKLAAFSGIARGYVSAESRGRYLAGLWEKELCKGLLWSRSWETHYPNYRRPRRRPRPWVAPSWSWASIQDPVAHRAPQHDEMRRSSDLRLVAWEVQPLGPDEYGELGSASLTVVGSVFDATIHHRLKVRGSAGMSFQWGVPITVADLSTSTPGGWDVDLFPDEPGLVVQDMVYECRPDYTFQEPGDGFVQSGADILCLIVSRLDAQPPLLETVVECLLLHRVSACFDDDGLGRYERIGSAELRDLAAADHWLARVSRKKLVLV